jgi:hypothetical protein
VPLENNSYFDDGGPPNPCFPQLDPVHNPKDRTYGLGRNVLRGPTLTNLDIALAKTTSITERLKLEFRAEFFNALNHPEFAQPTLARQRDKYLGPTFGQITTTGSFRGAHPDRAIRPAANVLVGGTARLLTRWSAYRTEISFFPISSSTSDAPLSCAGSVLQV